VEVLSRVTAAAPNAYEREARVLLAKAWLRIGATDSALAVLGHGERSPEGAAAALADSIRRARRR
jgi:hypothetical protein